MTSNEKEIVKIERKLIDYCILHPSMLMINQCYLIVLLARKKENGSMTERHKIEKTGRYILHKRDDIDHALKEITAKVNNNPDLKFRVYVSVNKRCMKRGLFELQKRIAFLNMDLLNGNQEAYTTIARMGSEWKSILALKECRAERRFLFDVDFDNKTTEGQAQYDEFLGKLKKIELDPEYVQTLQIFSEGKTKNGYAIVTEPFDVQFEIGKLPEKVELKTDEYLYLGILNDESEG